MTTDSSSEVVLCELVVENFRNHRSTTVEFPPGLTVISGANGEGKTNLLEAIAWLATLGSFRGASSDTMIGVTGESAIVRARLLVGGREQLIEAELTRRGRNRVLVNRQPLRRARDLLGTVRVVVFSPDDLVIVKGGPGERRAMLDDTLASLHLRHHADKADLDRVLRQRNTVLKQAAGQRTAEIEATLDVWDHKLAEVGERVAAARTWLVDALAPDVQTVYRQLSGVESTVSAHYRRSFESSLADALVATRSDDIKRRLSLVGPHRDEVEIVLDGLASRTHASQGEQRTLALALRLASQRLIAQQTGRQPIVLLDDVFSELDDQRARALMTELPAAQTVLTTATGTVPSGATAAASYVVRAGAIETAPSADV